jgi:hypothetical protein
MANGITVERTTNGQAFVRINLQKYGNEIMPFLQRNGIALDSQISTKPKNYLTHTEFVNQCNAEIDELCKEYGIL